MNKSNEYKTVTYNALNEQRLMHLMKWSNRSIDSHLNLPPNFHSINRVLGSFNAMSLVALKLTITNSLAH